MTDSTKRSPLVEELFRRYGDDRGAGGKVLLRTRFWFKKYCWIAVLGGTRLLKRAIDIAVAAVALTLLAPLFLIVALCIKLTDGGPILFWQKRVGLWGREFPFPKFRSMVVNAEKLRSSLLKQNDHQQSITFKMKRDPR